jgi:fluoride ion exporter CrcB/FEX
MGNLLLIGLYGSIETNLRDWVSGWMAKRMGWVLRWGTHLIIFGGSCLLAVVIAWASGPLPFASHLTESVARLLDSAGDVRP